MWQTSVVVLVGSVDQHRPLCGNHPRSSPSCEYDLAVRRTRRRYPSRRCSRACCFALLLLPCSISQDYSDETVGDSGERRLEVTSAPLPPHRSEEHTSELQSLMRISYAVFCLKKQK